MFRSDLAGLARQLLEIDGGKKLGAALAKVTDDVTDAYTEWAKANLHQVSQFGRAGQMAEFSNKADAERAIKRSGLVGKAVVLAVKRGQNRVVLSPGEAMQRGLWQGDGDKRINLSMDFVQDLVKLGKRRGSKAITIPWQLESTLEKRQRCSAWASRPRQSTAARCASWWGCARPPGARPCQGTGTLDGGAPERWPGFLPHGERHGRERCGCCGHSAWHGGAGAFGGLGTHRRLHPRADRRRAGCGGAVGQAPGAAGSQGLQPCGLRLHGVRREAVRPHRDEPAVLGWAGHPARAACLQPAEAWRPAGGHHERERVLPVQQAGGGVPRVAGCAGRHE